GRGPGFPVTLQTAGSPALRPPRQPGSRVNAELARQLRRLSRGYVPVVVDTEVDRIQLELAAGEGDVGDGGSGWRPVRISSEVGLHDSRRRPALSVNDLDDGPPPLSGRVNDLRAIG